MMLPAASSPHLQQPRRIDDPRLREVLRRLASILPDALLVGGAVRDILLGVRPADLDITVSGEAAAAAREIAVALRARSFVLDRERGQYRVLLPPDAPVQEIDVSSRGDSLEADLLRRDFTIDALAARLDADGNLSGLTDLRGGVEDMRARRLRMISEDTLAADPLRLLRAVRLATELALEIEEETAAAIRRLAPRLSEVAAERCRDELARILASNHAAEAVRLLEGLGLLAVLLPELMATKGVEQPAPHHYYDVFDHSLQTLAVLDALLAGDGYGTDWRRAIFQQGLAWYPLDHYLRGKVGGHTRLVLLKLAGLLHDIAKPETRSVEPDGRVRFFGHSELGARKAGAVLHRLRFGARDVRFVSLLVEEHLRPLQLSQGTMPTRRALYRFFRDLGEAAPACLVLSLADAAAAQGPRLQPEPWRRHVAYVSWVLAEGARPEAPPRRPVRLVRGDELMAELHIGPGPKVGRLLAAIEEAAAAGEVTTREEALSLARSLTSAPTLSGAKSSQNRPECGGEMTP